MIRTWALSMLLVIPTVATAHPGGEDSHGCHGDTKTGDYHCHKGPNAGKHFSSQDAMLKEQGKPKLAWKKDADSSPAPASEAHTTKPVGKFKGEGKKSENAQADNSEKKNKLKWKENKNSEQKK